MHAGLEIIPYSILKHFAYLISTDLYNPMVGEAMVTSSEVFEVIVVSMRDAFLAVTVFVAAMVLLFSWLQYITAGKFVDAIRANKRWQPVIGALMGITPGCGCLLYTSDAADE